MVTNVVGKVSSSGGSNRCNFSPAFLRYASGSDHFNTITITCVLTLSVMLLKWPMQRVHPFLRKISSNTIRLAYFEYQAQRSDQIGEDKDEKIDLALLAVHSHPGFSPCITSLHKSNAGGADYSIASILLK